MRGTEKVAVAFAGAVLVVALAAASAVSSLREVDRASEAREFTANLIIRSNDLLAEVSSAEAGQRAYAMTAETRFLLPYNALVSSIREKLQALRKLAAGRPSAPAADAMAALVDEKLRQMREVMDRRERNDVNAVIALTTAPDAQNTMASLRGAVERFNGAEREVHAKERGTYDASVRNTFIIILIVCGLALLFPLSFSYQVFQSTQRGVREAVHAELREQNVLLEAARAAADKASLAKSDFLSGMSHELRTPLNAILGFAQLIESGQPAPTATQKRSLEQILKAGWYLLELINEILDLSLIESGNVTMSREPVSLAEVMLECRTMIEPQAVKRDIVMRFPAFPEPCFINADRTRVKQVLINLLFNAIKYNKPGGQVTVEWAPGAGEVIRISVRDTGEGLAPEQLAQLFQPFNRIGQEAGAEEGTGIGLVVTKRLVEMMGGRIGVDSKVGVGSEFWIELAHTSAPQFAPSTAAPAAARLPAIAGTPRQTVLYVEDNPANLELVEQLIARRSDLRLISAVDARAGIEFARAYLPEVILMDINLSGMSGVEAMKVLHGDPLTAHIPIIALSANAVPREIDKGLEAGFFDYLTKPIKVDKFMDSLDLALKFTTTRPPGAGARDHTEST